MIITQTPLRIALGGGGTDLASYYSKFGGFWVSAAINKYVYITLNDSFDNEIRAHYSKIEVVKDISNITHPLIREAFKLTGLNKKGVEVTSMADVPAGTGLGSSGSYTVGLLRALHAYKREHITAYNLAEKACNVEIDILKEPIGKQDQYAAAFGGINQYQADEKGNVTVTPLRISNDTLFDLENNLLLFFTGYSRNSYDILSHQNNATKKDSQPMIENLNEIKKLGHECKEAIESGNTVRFGELMDIHWQNKKKRSPGITNPKIDEWYNIAMQNGAVGGKLIGAGGGGFLMFYAKDSDKLRAAMKKIGLRELRFKFDFEGSKIAMNYDNTY